ncbi:hypothetical protein Hypma_005483, partial [Hypsizygus marmoreus]
MDLTEMTFNFEGPWSNAIDFPRTSFSGFLTRTRARGLINFTTDLLSFTAT